MRMVGTKKMAAVSLFSSGGEERRRERERKRETNPSQFVVSIQLPTRCSLLTKMRIKKRLFQKKKKVVRKQRKAKRRGRRKPKQSHNQHANPRE